MRYIPVFIIMMVTLGSCTLKQDAVTVDDLKKGLMFIEYKEGMEWKEVSGKFGDANIRPLPLEGTTTGRNARVYKNKSVIFYTERKEVNEGEKIRFQEVITKIEIGQKK